MNTAMVQGSLAAIARQENVSLAESFLSADAVVLMDVSSSMETRDARDGQTRYEAACVELRRLQAAMPGKLAVIAFASVPQFCPGGIPAMPGGGTDLARALQFVAVADGTVRIIVISDGEPDDRAAALRVVRSFQSRIDTIFVGPADSSGAAFLRELAQAHGGQHVVSDRAQLLAEHMQRLLLAGV